MPPQSTAAAAPGRTPQAIEAPAGPATLLTSIVRATNLRDVLPQLHRLALDAAGGLASTLFELNAYTGSLHPTSGFAGGELTTDVWQPADADAELLNDAYSRASSTLIVNAARQIPSLAARLGTNAVLLLPLRRGAERLGLLALGITDSPGRIDPAVTDAADAFIAAIELFRLRQNEQLQRAVRTLLDEFALRVGATLDLPAGLETFCRGANRLFGAVRTSVWVHDRRARRVVLRASSEAMRAAASHRIATDDPTSPAVRAIHGASADYHHTADAWGAVTLTVPLRGCRRAVGSLVVEGLHVEIGRELAVLGRADQLGRQLSSVMENIQLLDDLTRSRRELENTFDSITHLVAVWDRRGRIAHVNHAFATRVGLSREELLDRPLEEFVGADLRRWLARQSSDEPIGGGVAPVTIEVHDQVLKGPFMVTVTALRNHEGDRVGSVLVARDLTAQARMQEEREELRRRLNQSEKLAALGQFVAGIAHELNNPLQGVLGHLELLRATGAFPKKLRREVQTIYREADRAAKIVRNLLAFSGSRRPLRRPVSVNAVLQKVASVRASACRAAEIELVRHYDAKLPRVQSDPLLLHQLFLNIVMNAEHAVAATRRGGRIEISTAGAPAGDRVIVTVRDTGDGIPADVASRIFEPFYTTKEVGQGSGLGLAITYGIVQEHGGDIIAANHPDGGAVFTIELPIQPVSRGETEAVVVGLTDRAAQKGPEGR